MEYLEKLEANPEHIKGIVRIMRPGNVSGASKRSWNYQLGSNESAAKQLNDLLHKYFHCVTCSIRILHLADSQ